MNAIWSKDDLVAAIKKRRSELGLSQIALDHEAGLPDGYTGKIEASAGKPNSRSIGWESLPKILEALGLTLDLNTMLTCPKQESINGYKKQSVTNTAKKINELFHKRSSKGGLIRAKTLSAKRRKEIARVAGRSKKSLSPARRKEIAQKAARARWLKWQEQGE